MFFGVLDFSTIVSNRILLKILVVRLLIGLYKSSWCIMEEQQVITLLPSLPSLSSFSLNHGPLFNMVWEPLHHAAKCLRYLSVGSERVSLFCGALGNSFFSFFDTVYFSSSCFFFRSQDRIFCCWVFFFLSPAVFWSLFFSHILSVFPPSLAFSSSGHKTGSSVVVFFISSCFLSFLATMGGENSERSLRFRKIYEKM